MLLSKVPSIAIHVLTTRAAFIPGKPKTPLPRSFTFAPNVTPVTYVAEGDFPDLNDPLQLPSAIPDGSDLLAPGSSEAVEANVSDEQDPDSAQPTSYLPNTTSRRRAPPGKRRSQGYIPRPPNAFMLFRADFVRQKHVPGSIETNHGSLSKIIGMFLFHLA